MVSNGPGQGPFEGGVYKFFMTVICMVVTWFRNGKNTDGQMIYGSESSGEWIAAPRVAEG